MADGLPLGQDLGQVLGAQDVTQGGGRQEARGAVGVLDVGDGHGGVLHAVVDHGVHRHRHRVTGQNLPDNKHQEVTGWESSRAEATDGILIGGCGGGSLLACQDSWGKGVDESIPVCKFVFVAWSEDQLAHTNPAR